jgi:hypothetical protein
MRLTPSSRGVKTNTEQSLAAARKQIKNQAAKCTHSHKRENLASKEKSMALDTRDPNQDSATTRGRHLQW